MSRFCSRRRNTPSWRRSGRGSTPCDFPLPRIISRNNSYSNNYYYILREEQQQHHQQRQQEQEADTEERRRLAPTKKLLLLLQSTTIVLLQLLPTLRQLFDITAPRCVFPGKKREQNSFSFSEVRPTDRRVTLDFNHRHILSPLLQRRRPSLLPEQHILCLLFCPRARGGGKLKNIAYSSPPPRSPRRTTHPRQQRRKKDSRLIKMSEKR